MEVQVLSVNIMDNGRIELTIYVTAPDGILSSESLASALEEASMPGEVLSQNGVTVLEIHGTFMPSPTPAVPPSEHKDDDQLQNIIIIGAAVGVAIFTVVLIALTCFVW